MASRSIIMSCFAVVLFLRFATCDFLDRKEYQLGVDGNHRYVYSRGYKRWAEPVVHTEFVPASKILIVYQANNRADKTRKRLRLTQILAGLWDNEYTSFQDLDAVTFGKFSNATTRGLVDSARTLSDLPNPPTDQENEILYAFPNFPDSDTRAEVWDILSRVGVIKVGVAFGRLYGVPVSSVAVRTHYNGFHPPADTITVMILLHKESDDESDD